MTDVRVQFRGYVPERLPSGEVRHRVRVEGQPKRRIRIPVGPDHPDFSEHYHAARVGKLVEDQPAKPLPKSGTLEARCAIYLAHLEQMVAAGRASPLTMKQRRPILKQVCMMLAPNGVTRMGDLDEHLPPTALRHIQDQYGARTGAADNAIKALSAAFNHRGGRNPAREVKKVHVSRGGATPWSTGDVRTFLDHHGPGTTARLWLMLALFSTARISDVVRLGRQHEVVRDGVVWIDFQPVKRGSAFASLPMMPQFIAAHRAMKVQGPTYILSSHGRPYRTPASLNQRIDRWTTDAGLSGRTQHGVRKATAELMAEVGCSDHEIAAVMAHTKVETSHIYTLKAERRRMANSAIKAISTSDLFAI